MKHHVREGTDDFRDRYPEDRISFHGRRRLPDLMDDERWERDPEFDQDSNIHNIVRDVLHNDRGRQMGTFDSAWLRVKRLFSGINGYHRACKFINFMKMLEAQN